MDSDVTTQVQTQSFSLWASFRNSTSTEAWVLYDAGIEDEIIVPAQFNYDHSTEDQFPLQPYVEETSPMGVKSLIKTEPVAAFKKNFIYWRPAYTEGMPATFYINLEADKLRLTLGEPSLFLFRIELARSPGSDWPMPSPASYSMEIDVSAAVNKAVSSYAQVLTTSNNLVWYAALSGVVKEVVPSGTTMIVTVAFPFRSGGYVQVFVNLVTQLVSYQHRMTYRTHESLARSVQSSESDESFEVLENTSEAAECQGAA